MENREKYIKILIVEKASSGLATHGALSRVLLRGLVDTVHGQTYSSNEVTDKYIKVNMTTLPSLYCQKGLYDTASQKIYCATLGI